MSAVETFQNELGGFKVDERSFHFGPRKNARHWKSLEIFLAVSVIGGLAVALLLSLVITSTIYSVLRRQ